MSASRAIPAVVLCALMLTPSIARRVNNKVDVKKVDSEETNELSNAMDAEAMQDADLKQLMALAEKLQQRSSQNHSFAHLAQHTLEKSVTQKDKPKAKNGWCLPHQQCSWGDCCAWGTSCNTCPGGNTVQHHACWGKGNFQCNKQKEDCQGRWPDYWSQCSKTCGGGEQVKEYIVTSFPANGGAACPTGAAATQRQACNTDECCPATVYWHSKDEVCEDTSASTPTKVAAKCCGH